MKKASEIILELQELIEKHGDLPVLTSDPDSYYRAVIPSEGASFYPIDTSRNYGITYYDGFIL